MMDEGDNMKRVIELERQDAAYRVLEEAANALEISGGNELYQRAWRLAADFCRSARRQAGAGIDGDD
jgi:hypothetical protein